ncbi:MAG: glycosyltransferase family 2 protein [Chloroflexota bacterium]|nr:glycosyltransferase family 2 protein [Dehalococcoidia bacterium]MDW8254145.1 glycosyltransferase family 2 protein [Chloroflexota bacterium]
METAAVAPPAPQETTEPLVSVVLPAYNEEESIGLEIERIQRGLVEAGIPFELIVVDDGSSDRTAEIAAHYPGVRLLRHRTNRGAGAARKTGTLAARGEIVVWTDSDLTYPNDRIADFVRKLGDADQIVGARTSEQGSHKFLRAPAKWFIRKLASYLAETDIPDLNSGFRAFRRAVGLRYVDLLPRGFSCVSTLTLAFLCDGYEVRYEPIEYRPRVGRSKFHPVRDAYLYLIQVLRMITYFNPLRVFLPIALVLGAIGLAKLGLDLYRYNWRVTPGTLMIVLTALQIFALGLVADLVVRRVR